MQSKFVSNPCTFVVESLKKVCGLEYLVVLMNIAHFQSLNLGSKLFQVKPLSSKEYHCLKTLLVNWIGSSGMSLLSDALEKNTTLTELNLNSFKAH